MSVSLEMELENPYMDSPDMILDAPLPIHYEVDNNIWIYLKRIYFCKITSYPRECRMINNGEFHLMWSAESGTTKKIYVYIDENRRLYELRGISIDKEIVKHYSTPSELETSLSNFIKKL